MVAKNVRPYAIVVGNPAKEIKRGFDDAKRCVLRPGRGGPGTMLIVANFLLPMAPPVCCLLSPFFFFRPDPAVRRASFGRRIGPPGPGPSMQRYFATRTGNE